MTRTPNRKASPETFRALMALDSQVMESLGAVLYDLVKLRASQINGCVYCVDKHATDLERQGVPTRKIHGIVAWQESPFFDATERVVLGFTESLTAGIDPIDDDLWDEAGRLLGDRRRADLLVAVGTITTLNISGITTHLKPQGSLS